MYEKVYLPFLIGIFNHFSGRFMRNYIFCLFLTLCTISLEDLAERICFICCWDCGPFPWKICQKVYLPLLIVNVYHFSATIIRKYIFRLFLTLCSISLEKLWERISFVSYWDCVPFFWKIYQKVNLPFLIRILYQFSARSIRKYIFRFFLRFCTISLENISESISSVSYWDCFPFLRKVYEKLYLLFIFDIVYHFSGRSARKNIFHFLLGLCTISLEDMSESISSASYSDCVPFLSKNYQKIYPPVFFDIVYHFSGKSITK